MDKTREWGVRSVRSMMRAAALGWKPLRWDSGDQQRQWASLIMEAPASNRMAFDKAQTQIKQSELCTDPGGGKKLTEEELQRFSSVIEAVVGARPHR